MTDYKELSAELLAALKNAICVIYGDGGTQPISTADAVIAKADAALAQPEPKPPTRQELKTFACEWWRTFGFTKDKATCTWVIDEINPEHFVDFMDDTLAQYGNHPNSPDAPTCNSDQ